MMKKYETPNFETVLIQTDDVITTSTGGSPFVDGNDLWEPVYDLKKQYQSPSPASDAFNTVIYHRALNTTLTNPIA